MNRLPVLTICIGLLILTVPASSRAADDATQPGVPPAAAVFSDSANSPAESVKSAYLIDMIKITMRTGPGLDYKVKALPQVGQKIDILEKGKNWTRIRTTDGKEGWVSNRFVGTRVPNRLSLERLQKKYEQLEKEVEPLKKENAKLKTVKQNLEEKLKARITKTDERLAELSEENRRLKRRADDWFLKWFLAGAGVLFLGIVIGFLARRERRRLYFK